MRIYCYLQPVGGMIESYLSGAVSQVARLENLTCHLHESEGGFFYVCLVLFLLYPDMVSRIHFGSGLLWTHRDW